MKTVKSTLLVAALMCTPAFALAAGESSPHGMGHHGMGHQSRLKAMDTNNDGMISRDEFMKAHDAMWDKMPKNKDGMVSIADMQKMHDERKEEHQEKMKARHDAKQADAKKETR